MAPNEHNTWKPVTPSITMPSLTMVAPSPLETPSSMIAALTVGRYSDARVLIICSTISVATSRRYGRMYWRSSARSIWLLSHTVARAEPAREAEMPDQVACRWLTRWAAATVHPVDQQQAQQQAGSGAA